jgi:hypothetical protein
MMIGWLHTASLNDEGNAEITEKKIGEEGDREGPDQELGCYRGKKELSNLRIDPHPL